LWRAESGYCVGSETPADQSDDLARVSKRANRNGVADRCTDGSTLAPGKVADEGTVRCRDDVDVASLNGS